MSDKTQFSPPHSALHCANVSKSYGDRILFNHVSIEINQGESVALLGPSGSGKSTLLHCLNGIEPIDSGEIYIDGLATSSMGQDALDTHRRHKVGSVFQFFHLLPTLTAYENIELSLQLIGEHPEFIAPRVKQIMTRLDISSRANAFPRDLSGGEKQRVAIARAIAHHPKVIFADEPTGNLDAKSGEEALTLLKEVCYEEEAALFMVTHSERDAAICDRKFMLEREQLITID